jgi:hypothetical protein
MNLMLNYANGKRIRQKQREVGGANVAVIFNDNVRKQERVLESLQ